METEAHAGLRMERKLGARRGGTRGVRGVIKELQPNGAHLKEAGIFTDKWIKSLFT